MMMNGSTGCLRGAALLAFVVSSIDVAKAQINCETIPAGPARTDCYIGLSLINRQKSEIAASAAQQQTDSAMFRRLTGKRPRVKWYRAVPDQ
jgi:hypothetical protein